MLIRSLSVRNFRNIASADFIFDPKVNIFTGNNAQGKTNLCEAISVCLGKSFRSPRAGDILPFGSSNGETALEMSFTFDSMPDKVNTVTYIQKNGSIRLRFNDIEMKEAEKLYGALRYVIFIPEDLYIVKGEPANRRDYLDSVSNMINRVHITKLYEYNKALKQKNNILMNYTKLDNILIGMLESWNETIARAGVNVMCGRLKYFSSLSEAADRYYGMLTASDEKLKMKYISTVMDDENFTSDDYLYIYERYLMKLKSSAERELKMKYTVVGAHRDDIGFFINDMPAKEFGSQGQIRSIAVALKLAEAEMIYSRSEDQPVVILDDVLSELDAGRRSFILNHIDKHQIFITSCNLSNLGDRQTGKAWNVDGGKFTPEEV
ncbi:MAG: DNA replication and repair protein RecF [Ruminiclostridium sp.]|nr:DNA replication and repair protein RecF [Ruminiclostridium sp.]